MNGLSWAPQLMVTISKPRLLYLDLYNQTPLDRVPYSRSPQSPGPYTQEWTWNDLACTDSSSCGQEAPNRKSTCHFQLLLLTEAQDWPVPYMESEQATRVPSRQRDNTYISGTGDIHREPRTWSPCACPRRGGRHLPGPRSIFGEDKKQLRHRGQRTFSNTP